MAKDVLSISELEAQAAYEAKAMPDLVSKALLSSVPTLDTIERETAQAAIVASIKDDAKARANARKAKDKLTGLAPIKDLAAHAGKVAHTLRCKRIGHYDKTALEYIQASRGAKANRLAKPEQCLRDLIKMIEECETAAQMIADALTDNPERDEATVATSPNWVKAFIALRDEVLMIKKAEAIEAARLAAAA